MCREGLSRGVVCGALALEVVDASFMGALRIAARRTGAAPDGRVTWIGVAAGGMLAEGR